MGLAFYFLNSLSFQLIFVVVSEVVVLVKPGACSFPSLCQYSQRCRKRSTRWMSALLTAKQIHLQVFIK